MFYVQLACDLELSSALNSSRSNELYHGQELPTITDTFSARNWNGQFHMLVCRLLLAESVTIALTRSCWSFGSSKRECLSCRGASVTI